MIKVALTNLGQYSEGILNYTWLNLPATNEEIKNALLSISVDGVEYEEYFITDYESEVSGLEISEYANLDELNELAEKLTELEEFEIDLVGAVMRTQGTSLKKALEKYEDISYVYLDTETIMSNEENLAYSFIDSAYGDISYLDRNTLEKYFDFDGFGRDLRIEGIEEEFEIVGHSDEEIGVEYVEIIGGLNELSKNTLESYFDYEFFGRDLSFDYEIDRETMIAISNY